MSQAETAEEHFLLVLEKSKIKLSAELDSSEVPLLGWQVALLLPLHMVILLGAPLVSPWMSWSPLLVRTQVRLDQDPFSLNYLCEGPVSKCCKKGDPFQDLRMGFNTLKCVVQGDTCWQKARLHCRGAPRQRAAGLRETRRASLPRGSQSQGLWWCG